MRCDKPCFSFCRALQSSFAFCSITQGVAGLSSVGLTALWNSHEFVSFVPALADEIAHTAEFFSFGTNDLTQTTPGMSRDDSGSFPPGYAELEIVKKKSLRTATFRHA